MAIRRCAYLLHVNVIITVVVACCYGWRSHVISAWNRCHDDSHVMLYNRRLDTCVWECEVRESCVAVQYQRMKRACGVVTASELEGPLDTCLGFVFIRRSDMNVDPKSCDAYGQSSTDSSCITECTVPDNPRIYSTMEGFPAVGSRIKLMCNPPLKLVGNQSLLCERSGEFDVSVPVCRNYTNIALLKPTTQSSLYHEGGVASLAVDGNTDGNYRDGQGSCTHTERRAERPWWVVDLQNDFLIRYVEIYNRVDCICPERLQNVYIYASTTDNLHNAELSGSLCDNKTGPFGDPTIPILFQCQGDVVGRYLKIILDRLNEILTLCEVKVFGDTI